MDTRGEFDLGTYGLKAELLGHSQDVRVVTRACCPDGAIITGSRDLTTRMWAPIAGERGYREVHCLKGPTGYISALCSLPPSDQFSSGLILVGAHDCNIYCFDLKSSSPLYKLLGHSGPVCSLSSGQFGTFVSGSWDKSARVWSGQKLMMTLDGHQGAVWAVAVMPQQELILTGSADKTIRLWRAGKNEKTFIGHEDCVRGLAIWNSREFLSCSNDGTVRLWDTSGDCLQVYKGHSSFVYSISTLENSDHFVTCGEDRTIRVWKYRDSCKQIINMPCSTVWSVDFLNNGDIVAGANDGTARVFTRDESQQVGPDELRAFQALVSKTQLPRQTFTDVKGEDLPGIAILNQKGKREGQTILVKENDSVSAFMWSMAEDSWQKIGDVVEGPPDGGTVDGKITFEGCEYDHVFNVDVEDGGKPLKLPYNTSDDPWIIAQQFIFKHNLPQDYLDKIANFICDNARVGRGGASDRPEFSDPFTGGSRYVPGSSRSTSIDATQSEGTNLQERQHIPYAGKWIAFDIANTSGMLQKLREFNGQVPPDAIVRKDSILDGFKDIVECKLDFIPADQLAALETLISWPEEFIFPVLDILRCAVRKDTLSHYLCRSLHERHFERILNLIASEAPANQMLALRFFVNLFSGEAGRDLILRKWKKLIEISTGTAPQGNKNTQIALSSLVLNFVLVVSPAESLLSPEDLAWLVKVMTQVIRRLTDLEAQFRLIVALGTLLSNRVVLCKFAHENGIIDVLSVVGSSGGQSMKLMQCLQQCVNLILDNTC